MPNSEGDEVAFVGAAGRRSSAHDELKSNAFNQKTCVIVNVHRERARSYAGRRSLD